MMRKQRLEEALRKMDFYELAKITYERSNPMKINIKQTKSEETLKLYGNKFFTEEQLNEIVRA